MKSPEMQQILDQAGNEVAGLAGNEYGHRTHIGDYTAITNVYPDSKEAATENRQRNTLVKALSSSGLRMKRKKGKK